MALSTLLFSLACVLVVATQGQLQGPLPATISYYVTVRSFMAAQCSSTSSATTRNSFCPNNAQIKLDVANNLLSGHPDFERNFVNLASGNMAQYSAPYANGKPLPVVRGGSLRPYVFSTLGITSTGIGKMRFCTGGEGYLCDTTTGSRSVFSEESFSTWYNDNPRFSRRSGYQQKLFLQLPSNQYLYNSAINDVDGDGFYDPIKENGLFGWPISNHENDILPGNKFWITTEIHASFQYRGNESFTFSGDDDVHVFINRKLAINLGGVHGIEPATILLDNFAAELGLVKGQIYEFDLFHAERQTRASNYGITTTLSEACNVVNSAVRTNNADVEQAIAWFPSGKTKNSDWTVIAGPGFGIFDANPAVTAIDLMRPGITNSVGYMFHTQQINVGSGFSMSFNFRATGSAGHGFSVIFHDRARGLTDLNGGMGPNLGIKNIDNSFAVAFDFCFEFPAACQTQQVRLHYKTEGDRLNSVKTESLRVFDGNVVQNWRDGQTHKVEIFYYAVPDWLEVYVDSSLRLVQKNFSVIDVLGGKDSFVGFAASSSDVTALNVRIDTVSVSTIKVVERFSLLANPQDATDRKTFVASGRDALTYTIRTRDACLSDIQFGGLAALAQGRLLSRDVAQGPPIVAASSGRRMLRDEERRSTQATSNNSALILVGEVIDGNDGSYTLSFKTDIIANFSVHLAFGSGCQWNGTAFISLTQDCFFVNIADAASSLPFITAAPTFISDPATLPQATVVGLGVSAGVILSIGSLLLVVGVRYRNQWRRDKRFVEAGRLAAIEKDLKYEGDSELDALQARLQRTIQMLQTERARKNMSEDKDSTIQQLLREKGEVQEIIRRMKAQKMGEDPDAPQDLATQLATLSSNMRKSFAPSRVSQRMSRIISMRAPVNFRLSVNSGADSPGGESSFSKLRQSVSRGFNRIYSTNSTSSGQGFAEMTIPGEEKTSSNPLFVHLKQQHSRPAGMSTDSTSSSREWSHSTSNNPASSSPPQTSHNMSPLTPPGLFAVPKTFGGPSTIPKVPPRPDAASMPKMPSNFDGSSSHSSSGFHKFPQQNTSVPRVPPRSDASVTQLPKVPSRPDAALIAAVSARAANNGTWGSQDDSSTWGSIGSSSGSSTKPPRFQGRMEDHI